MLASEPYVMEYFYSDSSSDSEGLEGLEDAIEQLLMDEDVTKALWYGQRSFEDLSEDEEQAEQQEELVVIAARAYQIEMLEASLRQNIICAMDTGSGKTQV